MNLVQRISGDIKLSMIARNPTRTTLLRTIIGEFDRIGKDITDDKCISIIKKMKDNAVTLNDVDEVEILSEYLPDVLSKDEIIKIVNDLFLENSYTQRDMGTFMKKIKTTYGQTIDMKIASTTFKELI